MKPQDTFAGPTPAGYRSFLLRLWTPARGGTRVSLTDVDTDEIHVFSDLEGLHDWLMLVSRPRPTTGQAVSEDA